MCRRQTRFPCSWHKHQWVTRSCLLHANYLLSWLYAYRERWSTLSLGNLSSKRVHGEECGSQCNTLVQEKKAAAGLSWFVHPATRLSLLFVLVLELESQIQYAYWMVVQDSVIPRTLQKSRTKEDGAVIPHVFLRLLRCVSLMYRDGLNLSRKQFLFLKNTDQIFQLGATKRQNELQDLRKSNQAQYQSSYISICIFMYWLCVF